jgi:hypothetical protein
MHHTADRHTATSRRRAREQDFSTGGLEQRWVFGLVLVRRPGAWSARCPGAPAHAHDRDRPGATGTDRYQRLGVGVRFQIGRPRSPAMPLPTGGAEEELWCRRCRGERLGGQLGYTALSTRAYGKLR